LNQPIPLPNGSLGAAVTCAENPLPNGSLGAAVTCAENQKSL